MAETSTLLVSNLFAVGWAWHSSSAGSASGILVCILTSLLLFLLRFPAHFFFFLSYKPKKQLLPPGPTPWPIVGSLITLLRNKPRFRWILRLAEGKDITCIRLGGVHMIVVNSPEIGREFLKKHDASFASRPITMGTEYSSSGFLSLAVSPLGDQWKKMRRAVTSGVINSTTLRWMAGLRVEEADHLVRYLYNHCKESALVDVRRTARYYSGNVIRRMMFNRRHFGEGGRNGGPGEEEIEHVESAFHVLSLIFAFCVSDFIPWLRWFDVDGHERKMKKVVRAINMYHHPIIDDRILESRRGGEEGLRCMKEPEDLLDVMISLKDSDGKPLLSPEEIMAQTVGASQATSTPNQLSSSCCLQTCSNKTTSKHTHRRKTEMRLKNFCILY